MTKIKGSQTNNGKLMLVTSYDPEIMKRIKSIKGYWWHKDGKYWTLSYTNEVIIQLKSKLGLDNLDIDKSIKASFVEDSNNKSSNNMTFFTEVFPIKKAIIPKLTAYELKVKIDSLQKIGGKLSYQLKNRFKGYWIWSNYRIITDNPQDMKDIIELIESLWSQQPEVYKDLIDIKRDDNWQPSNYDLAKFAAYGLIDDLQPKIKEILQTKAYNIRNARIDRVCDMRPWIVNSESN